MAVVVVKALVAAVTVLGLLIPLYQFYKDNMTVLEPAPFIADPCMLITDTPATMGAGSSVD